MENKVLKYKEIEILYRKCFVFALDIIDYSELLKKNKSITISEKIFNAGTVLGENISKLRFINDDALLKKTLTKTTKLISNTKYWLNICKYSQKYPNPGRLNSDIEELKTLVASINYNIKES